MDKADARKIHAQVEEMREGEHRAFRAFAASVFGRGHIRGRRRGMAYGDFNPRTVRRTIQKYLVARSKLYSAYAGALRTFMKDMAMWDKEYLTKRFGSVDIFKAQAYASEVYSEILDKMADDAKMMAIVVELLFATDEKNKTESVEKAVRSSPKQAVFSKPELMSVAALRAYLTKQKKESAKPLRYVI